MMSGRVLLFERNNIHERSLMNLHACPGNHGRIAKIFCVTHDSDNRMHCLIGFTSFKHCRRNKNPGCLISIRGEPREIYL
jgi:hypothetical protein